MTIDQIRKALETKNFDKATKAARRVSDTLKKDGVDRGTIDANFSGSEWYEFVKACGEDLGD
jgi:hypothetical protein